MIKFYHFISIFSSCPRLATAIPNPNAIRAKQTCMGSGARREADTAEKHALTACSGADTGL
ncbi:hypothetical protein A2642_05055 [Candidatus Nomurabacteria bacterium RIFCSPHIGHO2_01_FULL_39_10]|uniref:Uncharacterized protein n=1 Tax=Candidatus Nomurabacteria bacterium RIFCSPHIGHO2_01_FULL_39_10 TaxID=1801733 RepID=A0A1F6V7Z9_9BACT|nr:MAG: hypothetical protein A2642_05055 [Candidatus Nomurabacteria bacterium RIFCSPHIGHO2_01_FULL_39_10]